MFAHDLCHNQVEYFSLRLRFQPVGLTGRRVDPMARRGMLSIQIEKTERSLRLVGVVAPTPRRAIQQIVNIQFPEKRDLRYAATGLSGLGLRFRCLFCLPMPLSPIFHLPVFPFFLKIV
jgi:hypothetical protein